jgi:hypothetical protein
MHVGGKVSYQLHTGLEGEGCVCMSLSCKRPCAGFHELIA